MSRAQHLFNRFGTLTEQNKGINPMQRVNTAASAIVEQEENDLGMIEKIVGVGASEGHSKAPAFSEHGPNYVRFAALTQQGQPFIAVMPRISVEDAISWVNRRIQGFKANPKSRESVEEAIRRKAIAAMGQDFVDAMKNKGGEMLKMELDMMMSPDSHSGIGDLSLLSKKSNVIRLEIDNGGVITGMSTGIMTGSEGQMYATADMLNNLVAQGS